MTVEERRKVAEVIRSAVDPERFETIASGSQTPDDVIPARIDEEVGFWKKGHSSKPPRWLVHLEPDDQEGVRAVVPPQDGQRRLGQGNTTGGKLPKVCLVFQVVPLAHDEDGAFARVEEWEWILYFVLKRPSPKVTSSTSFTAPNLAEGMLEAQGQPIEFAHAGLVKLLDSDRTVRLPEFAGPITYGEVSEALRRLLERDQAPEG